jgi:nicotinate-nucleotide--dimethylbenzimidazole phosphoribosyltransferase
VIGRDVIEKYLDSLAKPRGSLGRLERIAARLAEIQGTLAPITKPRRVVLFAADHGVVEAGVTAWPSSVTELMIATILAGRAASSVLANVSNTELRLVDVGTRGQELDADLHLYRRAIVRVGTANLALEPAMTVADFDKAWRVGKEEACAAIGQGCRLLAAGDMGIGNTTPSACIAMLLADLPCELAVGPGAGADAAVMARKRLVVSGSVARALPMLTHEPTAAIASVAGLEIVATAGFYAAAAQAGITIVLDGFISAAAALITERLVPGSTRRMIAGHVSSESGHAAILAKLGLEPVLDWRMRLGEGTGALIAMPLLDAAAALLADMATLEDLGVGRCD